MKAFTALAGALVFCSAASAAELEPIAAKSIHMGDVNGIAYYTVEPDGFHVVATLSAGEQGQPIRFITTLLPGQSTTISVPREVGQSEMTFQVRRVNDSIFVGDVKAADLAQ
jgi:hypothetical protein